MSAPLTRRWAACGLWRAIGMLAFNRISILGRERLPRSGATLYVATHRNGALDAAPYAAAVPDAIPLVSAQLHRTALGRWLFSGIVVARGKDRWRGIEADNSKAIGKCLEVLMHGGSLLIMPEGTSTLGPRHLPIRRGAARLVQALLQAGISPAIVPLAVHYEDPTSWQSRVEVLIGEPARPPADADLATLQGIVVRALQSVGANFADEDAQRRAAALAYAVTLGTGASYALALKYFEGRTAGELEQMMQPLESLTRRRHLCLHQGVPLIPATSTSLDALHWLLLAIPVIGFVILNAPALAAACIASHRLPDAPNVISFWRMTAGIPAGLAWAALMTAMSAWVGGPAAVSLYWFFSLAGTRAWYRFRKLTVVLCNRFLHYDAKPGLMQVHRELMENFPHDLPV